MVGDRSGGVNCDKHVPPFGAGHAYPERTEKAPLYGPSTGAARSGHSRAAAPPRFWIDVVGLWESAV